jgi:hypothetical protein
MVTPMDKATLRDDLELANCLVTAGHQHVERQREVVRRLERDGHDSREAHWLLGTFEHLLRIHVRDRDRLERAVLRHPN